MPHLSELHGAPTHLAVVAVPVYLMGVDSGGQFAQTATGVALLELALGDRTKPAAAGGMAFSENALGCASCHGDRAQGLRGPRLAGGVGLDDFRRVHGHGLFPPSVVTDKDFEAIDAWLRTLAPARSTAVGNG